MKRPTKPRKLRVVRHKSRDRCGKDVIWCGPGSDWENPWRARQHEPAIAEAIRSAHIQFNDPPWVNAGGILHGPRHAKPPEKATAQVGLYRVWVDGRVGQMPKALRIAMERAIGGDGRAAPFPPPPSAETIRIALRGRKLADSADRKFATHAFVLLEIANAPGAAAP